MLILTATSNHFNPPTPWGVGLPDCADEAIDDEFQSTHPVGGGTLFSCGLLFVGGISIHPPRGGWDIRAIIKIRNKIISIHPPRGGWDAPGSDPPDRICISIHPPRGGWDHAFGQLVLAGHISIHPPRGGWDLMFLAGLPWINLFQSTHPVGGGTSFLGNCFLLAINFNPPTPWGVGRPDGSPATQLSEFQSTHPVGGGTPTSRSGSMTKLLFQSTHPVGGGTAGPLSRAAGDLFQSTHPVGGGTATRTVRKSYKSFQSTHPVGGGTAKVYKKELVPFAQ